MKEEFDRFERTRSKITQVREENEDVLLLIDELNKNMHVFIQISGLRLQYNQEILQTIYSNMDEIRGKANSPFLKLHLNNISTVLDRLAGNVFFDRNILNKIEELRLELVRLKQ